MKARDLVRGLQGGRKSSRLALKFLLERAPARYTIRQLATWLGYPLGTYKANPPTTEILGFVSRDRDQFFADLGRVVEDEFAIFRPDIGDLEMALISEWLRQQIVAMK